jgi:hypothetical protein
LAGIGNADKVSLHVGQEDGDAGSGKLFCKQLKANGFA